MKAEKQSIWKKPWRGWRKTGVGFVLLNGLFFLLILGLIGTKKPVARISELLIFASILSVCASLAALSAVFLIRWLRHWCNLRRFLFGAACFATLVAIFYAGENWRGKRAWEKCKRELEAKGEVIDWSAYIPAPVPDDQNVFKAPHIAEWFVRDYGGPGNARKEITSGKPGLSEFVQKLHSNIVAEVMVQSANSLEGIAPADIVLRYASSTLALMPSDGVSNVQDPRNKTIPIIEMHDTPLSQAISNLARMADCKFVYAAPASDPSQWRDPDGRFVRLFAARSREPVIDLKWENISPRSAFVTLLKIYDLAWIEDQKTGMGQIVLVDPSKRRVLVHPEVQERLQAILPHAPKDVAVGGPASLLSPIQNYTFATNVVQSVHPIRVVVVSDEQPRELLVGLRALANSMNGVLDQDLFGSKNNSPTAVAVTNRFHVFFAVGYVYSAADFLAWSDQFEDEFATFHEAVKRPYVRLEGDFERPFEMNIVDFVAIRTVAQLAAQRAQCCLLLGRSEQAVRELSLIIDLRKLLTAKPTTLVSAMIDVAICGLYTQTVADGFRLQAWREPELVAVQKHLRDISLPPAVAASLRAQRAAVCQTFQVVSAEEITKMLGMKDHEMSLWEKLTDATYLLFKVAPRGWFYQNLVTIATVEQGTSIKNFTSESQLFEPSKAASANQEIEKVMAQWLNPYKVLARIAIPHFYRALTSTARNQTSANEALIVCGLERYQRAQGSYPESLDALVPQFIEKLPHDVIGGQPLHYRRTADGKFMLYSVGWNETDDGGQPGLSKNGQPDFMTGDWVWGMPNK